MVLAFAVLAGAVWLLQTTNPPAPEGAATFVLEVNEGDVTRLDITTPAGSASFERIEPFGWRFAGTENPTDFNRVSSVVNRLAKLRSQAKVLDKVTDLAPYRLDRPTVAATLTMKDGSAHKILFGGKTVNDAAYYAMVEAKGVLYTVSTLIVTDAEKLVSEPPVPSPTPGGPTLTPTLTRVPSVTPTPFGTPTATLGIPLPVVPQATATPTAPQ
jgi:hypothetical protein